MMQNCEVCNSSFQKSRFSDHVKSVKHLEKLSQYYCKKCNQFMPLSDKENHLNSNEHKNISREKVYCEDCDKYVDNINRHLESETHNLKSQITHTQPRSGCVFNEKTYIKYKFEHNIEQNIQQILSQNLFPRYKYQVSYQAKFSKYTNGEEQLFFKWIKSDMLYNYTPTDFHNSLMQQVDDEQLEGSGFQFEGIKVAILEVYKIRDIQASSYIPLPPKYKNNKSILNIQNTDVFCFVWSILAHLFPVDDKHKERTSNYSKHVNKLDVGDIEFPMRIKDIPKFEKLNNLNINVFELNKTVLTPIYINTNYLEPQIDLLLYENHYCLILKLDCLINPNSHMKHVCRRCLTAFSSQDILKYHIKRCIKQQSTTIAFLESFSIANGKIV